MSTEKQTYRFADALEFGAKPPIGRPFYSEVQVDRAADWDDATLALLATMIQSGVRERLLARIDDEIAR